jgi:hypothetical protein
MSNRRVAGNVGSLAVALLLTVVLASNSKAQTHSATYNGWRITIDESPSPEFVDLALEDLKKYFVLPEPTPNVNCGCIAVGNYGGMIEPSDLESEIPFFRITDDIDEAPFHIDEAPFHTFVSYTSTNCNTFLCRKIAQFNLRYGGTTELLAHLKATIDVTSEPVVDDFLPLSTIEFGTYPVFVGPADLQNLSPIVWSVDFAAVPEPTTAALCFLAALAFGLIRRRAELTR